MSRDPDAASNLSPAIAYPSPGSVLPARATPRIAHYARGPFLEPMEVTPSNWKWRNTRTAIIRHRDGHDYRAVRVHVDHEFIGWWAVELLGVPLTLGDWED